MEEAYNELYQQFLRLRSLCLKQAALLQQLTTALQKQQGASIPNGELTQCGADYHSRNTKSFPDLLADDMTKLCVDVPSQRKESVKAENKFPLLLPLDSLACHGASYNESRNSKQNHPAGDRTLRTIRMPVMDCCTLINDFQGGSGGAMLSDVALQSHICEFCQAVFPGHTTTRGEFLRHLNTHVT
uniref:TRAF family member-associated NFKB activator n=1 Tax=Astatotilapia calliptera TaxID=8154 RepID=A0AAX7URX8_ASTCA